jgi:hypothetical protein
MEVTESTRSAWTLEVTDGYFIPSSARKKAKQKIAEDYAIAYDHLSAAVVDHGGHDVNPIVSVVLMPNRNT